MISVIVPCYNAEKFIDKCFESMKNQTYTNYEIIFINDGSEDKTLEQLKNIKENNSEIKIKIVNQENKGVSSARNTGIKSAEGEYISFIDPDDYIESNFFETLIKGIDAEVGLSIVGILKSTNSKRNTESTNEIVEKEELIEKILIDEQVFGYSCNKLFKKNIIMENDIFFREEISITEDLEFCLRYVSYIDRANINSQQLYNYYINPKSAMKSDFSDKDMTVIKSYNYMLENKFSRKNKEVFSCAYVATLLYLFRKLHTTENRINKSSYEKIIIDEIAKFETSVFSKVWRKVNIKNYIEYIIFKLSSKLLVIVARIHKKIKNKK